MIVGLAIGTLVGFALGACLRYTRKVKNYYCCNACRALATSCDEVAVPFDRAFADRIQARGVRREGP